MEMSNINEFKRFVIDLDTKIKSILIWSFKLSKASRLKSLSSSNHNIVLYNRCKLNSLHISFIFGN